MDVFLVLPFLSPHLLGLLALDLVALVLVEVFQDQRTHVVPRLLVVAVVTPVTIRELWENIDTQ